MPFARPCIGSEEIRRATACLQSGWLTRGPVSRAFEVEFAVAVGARHALSMSTGTMASLLLMQACGLHAGGTAVFPVWTFSGPPMMARKLGARVRFCDVDEATFCMTPETLNAVMDTSVRLVVPTHFAGQSADIEALHDICAENFAGIIDDAAHAFLTRDAQGQMVGAQGTDATFFSFYATKALTTGEGGMVTTNDDDLAEQLGRLRSHGMRQEMFDRHSNGNTGWRYDIVEEGWGAALSDIAASIGLGQLHRAELLLAGRRAAANHYDAAFRQHPGLIAPTISNTHSCHLYPLRVLEDRDGFIDRMWKAGVQCSMHFIPLIKHPAWAQVSRQRIEDFPVADRLARQEVSLPLYSDMTLLEAERVIEAVFSCLAA